MLWFNTALLLASSATLEVGRARIKTHGTKALKRWVCVTTLLGLSFVLGQLSVWRKLVADGVYLQSNPHSSFLYILTGLHGVHLLGGVLALAYLFFRTLRAGRAAGALDLADLAGMCATYWHFLSGLWVFSNDSIFQQTANPLAGTAACNSRTDGLGAGSVLDVPGGACRLS